MNAENFADFLNDKSNLYKLSYQELKTLALQYPYSANIQLLLTLKSKMEQHKDFDKNLEKAATLCPDRKYLLQCIKAIDVGAISSTNFLLKEDYLELKDLSQLEEMDKIPLDTSIEEESNGKAEITDNIHSQLQHESNTDALEDNNPFLNSSGKDYEDINLSDTLLNELLLEDKTASGQETESSSPESKRELQPDSTSEQVSEPQPEPLSAFIPESALQAEPQLESLEPALEAIPIPQAIILDLAAIAKVLADYPSALVTETESVDIVSEPQEQPVTVASDRPKPSPKSSFTSWVQQFQPDHTKLRLAEIMEAKKLEELKRQKKLKAKKKKKQKKKKTKKNKVIVIAQKSITENINIATETLAELLTDQGQYQKAIQVYHRLGVMYPEQKARFEEKALEIEGLINGGG